MWTGHPRRHRCDGVRGLSARGVRLLVGDPSGSRVERFVRCRNAAESAKVYTRRSARTSPRRASRRRARVRGHRRGPQPHPQRALSEPDRRVAGARPAWHYVIVGLKRAAPEFRSLLDRRRHDHRGTDHRPLTLPQRILVRSVRRRLQGAGCRSRNVQNRRQRHCDRRGVAGRGRMRVRLLSSWIGFVGSPDTDT